MQVKKDKNIGKKNNLDIYYFTYFVIYRIYGKSERFQSWR